MVNRDRVMDVMTKKFAFGGAEKTGVYFDEENRRHLNSIRLAYSSAASNLADNGRKEDAKKLLNKCDQNMREDNISYGMISRSQQHNQISLQFLIACYKAGDTALAKKVSTVLKKDMQQQVAFYESLSDTKRENLSQEIDRNNYLLQGLMQMEQQFTAQPQNNNPENPGVIKK
jgi:DNA-binding FadR family transcriptional regulator